MGNIKHFDKLVQRCSLPISSNMAALLQLVFLPEIILVLKRKTLVEKLSQMMPVDADLYDEISYENAVKINQKKIIYEYKKYVKTQERRAKIIDKNDNDIASWVSYHVYMEYKKSLYSHPNFLDIIQEIELKGVDENTYHKILAKRNYKDCHDWSRTSKFEYFIVCKNDKEYWDKLANAHQYSDPIAHTFFKKVEYPNIYWEKFHRRGCSIYRCKKCKLKAYVYDESDKSEVLEACNYDVNNKSFYKCGRRAGMERERQWAKFYTSYRLKRLKIPWSYGNL